MTNETNKQPAVTPHCWSCNGEIAPTDNFCRHCRMRLQPTSPSVNIHERLVSIEKNSAENDNWSWCGIASCWVDCATATSLREGITDLHVERERPPPSV